MVTIERIFHLLWKGHGQRAKMWKTKKKKKKKKKKRMVEQRMSEILRKGDLEGLVESFYIEDITPDIVCKLYVNKGFWENQKLQRFKASL